LPANPKLRYYLEAAFESKRNNSHTFTGEDTAYEKQKHIQKKAVSAYRGEA
jgi:hypothetical protein